MRREEAKWKEIIKKVRHAKRPLNIGNHQMSETTSITPTRPYMVRALYEWIEDNALTPYLMVDATAENVQIPTEHVQDGRIVLNIASRATGNMSMAASIKGLGAIKS